MQQINASTQKAYEGQNQITLTGLYKSNEWGTYLQWQALGFQVKKGQKGAHIVKVIKYTDAKGKEKNGMRTYSVFNREQVEGKIQLVNNMQFNKVVKGIRIQVKKWDNYVTMTNVDTGEVVKSELFSDHTKAINIAKLLCTI